VPFLRYSTPIGFLEITEDAGCLTRISFSPIGIDSLEGISDSSRNRAVSESFGTQTALLEETRLQLDAYFSGRLERFSLPLDPRGTAFQRRVWDALLDIPYGSTETYSGIARAVGNPRAARAVGLANNRNPLPIVIPCHRVIGKNGTLIGYAGGLALKRYLIDLESGRKP